MDAGAESPAEVARFLTGLVAAGADIGNRNRDGDTPAQFAEKLVALPPAKRRPLLPAGPDVTANDDEAIRGVMRVEIPGFGEIMRNRSMEITPNAILSRSLAAIVDTSLVIALPGKPSGAVECLGFVEGAIPHSVKLAVGEPTSC